MTWSEYFNRLMEIGTGWLGWTERETLDTSIPVIESAYEALLERLHVTQGGMLGSATASRPTSAPSEPREPPTSDSIFAAIRMAASNDSRRR